MEEVLKAELQNDGRNLNGRAIFVQSWLMALKLECGAGEKRFVIVFEEGLGWEGMTSCSFLI
jgi:hypothetical protein